VGLARAKLALEAAGHTLDIIEQGETCYIARARNRLVYTALESEADVTVFLDDDISATPKEWMLLVSSPLDFVFGAYRYKQEREDYPVVIVTDELGGPMVSGGTGFIEVGGAPAGFVAIKQKALRAFVEEHKQREYDECGEDGAVVRTIVDIWPTGLAHRRWWGEDYGLCNLWRESHRRIWCDPRLKPTHWGFDSEGKPKSYQADFDAWLRRLPPVQAREEA